MDFISHNIADLILFIGQQTRFFWENLTLLNFSFTQVFIDILLVSILFYYLFLILKGSRAVNILFGMILVAFVFAISKTLELAALNWILDKFLTIALVAIPVIFQQELRMALEKIGHTKFFLGQQNKEINLLINNIVQSCEQLAAEKLGGLIALENTVPLKEYIETGVALDAKVTKELLLNIFYPKSPMHDGAVILREDRIVAASCILPHTFKNYGQILGTRHKAALGLSEGTDAQIIVVSEEKGTISYAINGQLERNITPARLQNLLMQFYKPVKKKKQ